MNTTIYHNPRCSKSRETLKLIQQQGIEPDIIEYLKHPPTPTELQSIIQALGISAEQLLRKGEDTYKQLVLKDKILSDEQLIAIMVEHPKLIERPIVTNKGLARLGRPPESALEIL